MCSLDTALNPFISLRSLSAYSESSPASMWLPGSGLSGWPVLAVHTHMPHLWQQPAINWETRSTNVLKSVKEKEERGSKRGSEPNQSFGGMKAHDPCSTVPQIPQTNLLSQKEQTKAQRG